MPDLREKRVDLILQQLEELPTLPAVAMRVLQATGDNLTSARQIVDLISTDPALTARILQLVHRADAGVRGEVNSIERAVVLLGFDAVRSAVLAVSVFQSFDARPAQAQTGHFDRDDFWRHCVAVACCAELLAEAARSPELPPSEAFVCGLLHDLGKVGLDAALPKSFSKVVEAADLLRGNIADVERQVIGLDHMVVGKRLAEKWQLPALMRDCIWLHGQDPRALPATVKNPRMVNLVTLADQLVREQHLGYSGNYTFTLSRAALIEAVGLSAGQVEAALAQLVQRIEPRAASLGLGKSSTNELYQQALAQANKELGRVSGQLAAKNRRLQVRAQFFDALSRFQSELRPDAPPRSVLEAIAQTAVGVLGVPCVAVFSLPPGQAYAESLLCDQDGQVIENALIDLPKVSVVGRPLSVDGAGDAQHGVSDTHADNADFDRKPRDGVPGLSGDVSLSVAPLPTVDVINPSDLESPHSVVRPALPLTGDGPVIPAGEELDWYVSTVSPRLPHDKRFWICLDADGQCVGGVVWGGPAGEGQRLSPQVQELVTIASGWALALRMAQIRDEARQLAEQLAESNRNLQNAQDEILRGRTMITVGEMAAGAAHEMNNPLAVISGRSQLLASQLEDPKLKASANQIFEQSHRLSAIITELMHFAKPDPAQRADADVAEVIDRAVCAAKAGHDVADRKIEVTVGEGVPRVTVDAGQVSAAVAEVIANAILATDAKTGVVQVQAGYDPYSARVAITVTDNGSGMDASTLKRAFDPFFSAKKAGRRRGMGLAKAMRWVEASGGSIRLESQVGQGTRAVLLLPSSSSTAFQPVSANAGVRANAG